MLASPPIWLIRLDGHTISMRSIRDDSYDETPYFMIPVTFHYLSEKQREDLKWLITQGYEAIVDVGNKRIARRKAFQEDEVITEMNRKIAGKEEPLDWYDALRNIEDLAQEQMYQEVS